MRRVVASLVGAGALVLLTGCTAASEDDVRAVAAAFEDPGGDPEQRCDLLAPATRTAWEGDAAAPCTDAIADLPLSGGEITSVAVWGDDAQVRIGGDVVFLSGAGGDWRVTAAACEPRGELPYDCEVEGP